MTLLQYQYIGLYCCGVLLIVTRCLIYWLLFVWYRSCYATFIV